MRAVAWKPCKGEIAVELVSNQPFDDFPYGYFGSRCAGGVEDKFDAMKKQIVILNAGYMAGCTR